jgi:hypothetical protein
MYLSFFDLYVFFGIQYEIKSVANLHDTRPAPAAAGMLISEAGQLELVEANVHNLGYRATLVVPEVGGKAYEKPPRSGLRRSRLDPCSSPPEVVVAPPDALRHLAESSLLLRGMGRENNEAADGVRLALLPPCEMFSCPLSLLTLCPTPI